MISSQGYQVKRLLLSLSMIRYVQPVYNGLLDKLFASVYLNPTLWIFVHTRVLSPITLTASTAKSQRNGEISFGEPWRPCDLAVVAF